MKYIDSQPLRSPLRHLDPQALSEEARRESRRREAHIPPVSSYRWWARRTVAIAGGVLDAISRDYPGQLVVCDPFAGGGTVGLAATMRGHSAYLQDVNPWATQGLSIMFGLPSSSELIKGREMLWEKVEKTFRRAYATTFNDGNSATVAHTIRVAHASCPLCDHDLPLFPYSFISLLKRAEQKDDRAWLACRSGHVFLGSAEGIQDCPDCGKSVNPQRNYTTGRQVRCWRCQEKYSLEKLAQSSPFRWTVELVERAHGSRREIDKPTDDERLQAEKDWNPVRRLGSIADGCETRVLRRFGYRDWEDCYPARQRVMLEELLSTVPSLPVSELVRSALEIAIIGSTEMAGFLSRWDRHYLKSYEAMSSHRFNFTTLACEPNVWGAAVGRGTVSRRITALIKASDWLDQEVGNIRSDGPLSSGRRRTVVPKNVDVRVVEGSSERLALSDSSADLIWTDPPYHDDVHYGELSMPLRAWAGDITPIDGEAVANSLADSTYEVLLTAVFRECRRVLKDEGHLVLTYANREATAWCSLFASLRKAGFRACGYEVVVSDSDSDHAKRNVRSCTMDVILNLVPEGQMVAERWSPRTEPIDEQDSALRVIGDWFLRVVQSEFEDEWRDEFTEALEETAFLS